ncbi:MAG: hypothetical protein D6737_12960 [Chloroflexi bacterium]|nr:MAG: hypothetical protein D6737_12960 [Chloroflexota bacterium]
MGRALEAAQAITNALAAHDPFSAREWLADDFTFIDPSSPLPPPGPDEWLGLQAVLMQAFPDLDYAFEILEEKGNQVWVSATFTGTHNGNLDLSAMDMGVIPPTGKQVSGGRNVTVGTLGADGRVQSIEVVESGGGVIGMLQQVGVNFG